MMLNITRDMMSAIAVSAEDERRIVRLGKRLGVSSKAGVVRLAVDELERRVEREQLGKAVRAYVEQYTVGDASEPWIWDLFERAPDPRAASKVRLSSIELILRRHRIRRITAAEVRDKLRAPSFTVAGGVREGVVRRIEALLPQLRPLLAQLKQSHRNLERLLDRCAQADSAQQPSGEDRPRDEHSDVAILRSLPGVGRIVSAAVLAEAHGVLLQRDGITLRTLGGVAPVTKRSGKSLLVVQRRRACNARLSNALYHWGRTAARRRDGDVLGAASPLPRGPAIP
jgi:transposase